MTPRHQVSNMCELSHRSVGLNTTFQLMLCITETGPSIRCLHLGSDCAILTCQKSLRSPENSHLRCCLSVSGTRAEKVSEVTSGTLVGCPVLKACCNFPWRSILSFWPQILLRNIADSMLGRKLVKTKRAGPSALQSVSYSQGLAQLLQHSGWHR